MGWSIQDSYSCPREDCGKGYRERSLSQTARRKIKAMDVDHAFMHSPFPAQDVVVLKLALYP